MKTLLTSLLLLGMVAGTATAMTPVVVGPATNGCVTISLPSLPEGSEYHNVSLGSRHQSTLTPLQVTANSWAVPSSWDRGWIKGIVCTDTTCTPFEGTWSPGWLETPWVVACTITAAIVLALLAIAYWRIP